MQSQLDDYLIPDPVLLSRELTAGMPQRFRRLSDQLAGLVDQYSMVSFLPLDISEVTPALLPSPKEHARAHARACTSS